MGIFGIGAKKTPEEKRAEELGKLQEQLEKRIEERIKFVGAADDWVAVTVCDRYRFSLFSAPNIAFAAHFMARAIFPHLPDSKVIKGYVPPELKDEKVAITDLTPEEVQILLKEGFRCKVDGVWGKNGDVGGLKVSGFNVGGIWGKKCTDKKEAKEEAERIKELLGW